jgi:hypothetical protein
MSRTYKHKSSHPRSNRGKHQRIEHYCEACGNARVTHAGAWCNNCVNSLNNQSCMSFKYL